jgi:hypothetical protein
MIIFENHFELVLKLSLKDQILITLQNLTLTSHMSWNMILELDSFDLSLDDFDL